MLQLLEGDQGKPIPPAAQCLLALPFVYAFTAMWWIPEGDKYVPGLVTLSLLTYVVTRGWRYSRKDAAGLWDVCLVVLWLSVLYGALIYFSVGDSWTELRPSVFSVIYLSVLRGLDFNTRLFKSVVAVSALGLAMLSIAQWQLFDSNRVSGFLNPIPFATGLGALFLACLLIAANESSTSRKVALYGLSGVLFFCLFLTGTRGIVFPVVLVIIFVLGRYAFSTGQGHVLRVCTGAGALVVIAFMALTSVFESRFVSTLQEIERIEQGDYGSSFGLRIQMWQAAIEIIRDNPLGMGDHHVDKVREMHEAGVVSEALVRMGPYHYHNQYLDVIVKRGVLGLVFLLFILIFPVFLAARYGEGSMREVLVVSVVILFATAGLTDVPFRHPHTIYLFYFLIYLGAAKKLVTGIRGT